MGAAALNHSASVLAQSCHSNAIECSSAESFWYGNSCFQLEKWANYKQLVNLKEVNKKVQIVVVKSKLECWIRRCKSPDILNKKKSEKTFLSVAFFQIFFWQKQNCYEKEIWSRNWIVCLAFMHKINTHKKSGARS